MPRNHLLDRASREPGHVLDVRTKRAAVDHRAHRHSPPYSTVAVAGAVGGARAAPLRATPDRPQRIEIDRHRTVADDGVTHARSRSRSNRVVGEGDTPALIAAIDGLRELRRAARRLLPAGLNRVHGTATAALRACERGQQLLWMPSKPPFDMTTTRSPARSRARRFERCRRRSACSARRRPADADRRRAARSTAADPRAASSGTPAAESRGRPWRTRGRSRPGTSAGTTTPSAARRPPRSRRSGYADAHAGQRFGDRRRMVREIVVDRDAAGGAAHLQPPLHAAKRAQRLARSCSVLSPTAAPTAIAASALRTLCAPSSGTSNAAERRRRCAAR